MNELEKGLTDEVHDLVTLLLHKNADYGSTNLLKWGMKGILIRMDDKLARLAHLIEHPATVSDETMNDTLQDIAGYALMALMVRKGYLK